MMQSEEHLRQLQGMALLLQLQRMARNRDELGALEFSIVNETHSLVSYRQAALWVKQPLSRIASVSGVAECETNAPYVVWLRRVAETLYRDDASSTPRTVFPNNLSVELAAEWSEWSAEFCLWLPFRQMINKPIFGGLLLFRETAWLDAEIRLLTELSEAYAHAWYGLQPQKHWWEWRSLVGKNRQWFWGLPLLLLLPIHQTVLAPAAVIASDPTLVRAQVDGVVETFHIEPNQPVTAGQLLVTLENTDLANRLEIARKALVVAETEYRSAAQMAVLENKSKIDLNVLKGKIDQHLADVAYMEDQLIRSEIKAPHAGIAIFTDAQDWLGKPVTIGEKILQIADPDQVEMQMHLPVADLINFDQDAETVLYLNSDPQRPLEGQLYYASYEPEMTPDNIQAYRLKARLHYQQHPPRIGLTGTAKIHGQRVTLFYYMFRRPLAAVRQWLGM
jgi:hypothetical protein